MAEVAGSRGLSDPIRGKTLIIVLAGLCIWEAVDYLRHTKQLELDHVDHLFAQMHMYRICMPPLSNLD